MMQLLSLLYTRRDVLQRYLLRICTSPQQHIHLLFAQLTILLVVLVTPSGLLAASTTAVPTVAAFVPFPTDAAMAPIAINTPNAPAAVPSAPVVAPIVDSYRLRAIIVPTKARASSRTAISDIPFARQSTVTAVLGNRIPLVIELALSSAERQQGLMHRPELAADAGMLFVFPRERPVSFWMKDTIIPLSIAYLNGGGTIVSIHDMEPLSEIGVPSSGAVAYALEVNQGFFATHRIEVGDSISIADCASLSPLIDRYDEAVVDRLLHLCR